MDYKKLIIRGIYYSQMQAGAYALLMEDESGGDEKILAVPVDKLHPFYTDVVNYTDLPTVLIEQISHFFQHYKDLEKGKWAKVSRLVDVQGAQELLAQAIRRAEAKKAA